MVGENSRWFCQLANTGSGRENQCIQTFALWACTCIYGQSPNMQEESPSLNIGIYRASPCILLCCRPARTGSAPRYQV